MHTTHTRSRKDPRTTPHTYLMTTHANALGSYFPILLGFLRHRLRLMCEPLKMYLYHFCIQNKDFFICHTINKPMFLAIQRPRLHYPLKYNKGSINHITYCKYLYWCERVWIRRVAASPIHWIGKVNCCPYPISKGHLSNARHDTTRRWVTNCRRLIYQLGCITFVKYISFSKSS